MKLATTLDPAYALGWVGLATALFNDSISSDQSLTIDQRKALMTESFDDLEKAIGIDPDQSAAHYQLGTQLAATGQLDQGLQVLRGAKDIVPMTSRSPRRRKRRCSGR